MIVEYADQKENTQEILKSLTLALMMQVARQYAKSSPTKETHTLSEKIVNYIGEHIDTATLKSTAKHFSYHPNYNISTLLHKDLDKTFSEILLEQCMERAAALLKGTNLSFCLKRLYCFNILCLKTLSKALPSLKISCENAMS